MTTHQVDRQPEVDHKCNGQRAGTLFFLPPLVFIFQMSKQARRFALTLNNWTEAQCVALTLHIGTIFKYFLATKEVGEQETPHLQCYGETTNKHTIVGLKRKLLEIDSTLLFHIEVAKGTAEQNIQYCTKSNQPFLEVGPRPKGQGKRTDLDKVIEEIQSGESLDSIIRSHGGSYVKYANGIQRLFAFYNPPRSHMTIGYWLYGETGTGKSRWVHETFPGAFWKLPDCKWFDGYNNQETVVLDDYRPTKDLSFQMLLRLVDRYPMLVETKGGHINFSPKRLIITTPQNISETFRHLEWIGEENLQQIHRRFPHQLQFGQGNLIPLLQTMEPSLSSSTDG